MVSHMFNISGHNVNFVCGLVDKSKVFQDMHICHNYHAILHKLYMWFGKNELRLYLNRAEKISIGGRGPRGPFSKYAHALQIYCISYIIINCMHTGVSYVTTALICGHGLTMTIICGSCRGHLNTVLWGCNVT